MTDDDLAVLLRAAREATPSDRIGYRDPIAAFGLDAIETMGAWLEDPRLGAFAVRVLERMAGNADHRQASIGRLVSGRAVAATPTIAQDIADALGRLGAPVKTTGSPRGTAAIGAPRLQGMPGRGERGYWATHTWERGIEYGNDQRAFIWSEIRAGRLRQGWGWDDTQDLRAIHARLGRGIELTDWEAQAWRARRMLTDRDDAIHVDDIVIAVAVPEQWQLTVVRVIGPYSFDVNQGMADYGHLLPVELLVGPIDRHDPRVSEPLRAAIRNRTRLWRIDGVGGDVEALVRGPMSLSGSGGIAPP